jgi:hypothetical protein
MQSETSLNPKNEEKKRNLTFTSCMLKQNFENLIIKVSSVGFSFVWMKTKIWMLQIN